MSATLGGLLKDYRLQKNISQLEISFSVGWKEPSRLSRIEQGHVGRPKRELLNRIMDAMKLSEEESNRLLLAGGYLPDEKEIKDIQKRSRKYIEEWKYPVLILDFSWRVIADNKSSKKIYKIEKIMGDIAEKMYPNVLEIVTHPKYSPNKHFKQSNMKRQEKILSYVLNQFRYEQKRRTHEKWYTSLISRLMDNDLFKRIWKSSQRLEINTIATNHGRKYFPATTNQSQILFFDFFVVPLLNDPRFTVEIHVPADLETFKFFEKK